MSINTFKEKINMKSKSLIALGLALLLAGCQAAPTASTADSKSASDAGAASETVKVTERSAKDETTRVYVSPQWAKDAIEGKIDGVKDPVVIEASWGPVADAKEYKEGHIKGAVHADINSIEDEPYWNLRPADQVKSAILAAGVDADTPVIFYGSDMSGTSRIAFAYLWAGVKNVKIINGGYEAWKNAGFETETTVNEPKAKTDFKATVPVHPEYVLAIEDAYKNLESGDKNFKLVSIRSLAEFEGKTSGYSYIDKAGEPKGAVWGKAGSDPYHMEDYVHADNTVITLDEMKQLWSGLDFNIDNKLAFYCGTGWRATIPFLIMYENGFTNMQLYDGGWFQWTMNPDYPVQVGDPKSGNVQYTTVKELPNDKAWKEN